MHRSLIGFIMLMVGMLFVNNVCSAACPFPDGPYATVIKYLTGKKTVHKTWVCVFPDEYYSVGSGFCFYNQTATDDYDYICISGDYELVQPGG